MSWEKKDYLQLLTKLPFTCYNLTNGSTLIKLVKYAEADSYINFLLQT